MNNSRFAMYVFLAIFLFSILLVLQLLWAFISPVVLALVLVSIFNPIYHFFLKLFRNNKRVAASLTTLLIVLCVLIPLGFFAASLSQQALSFYENSQKTNIFGDFMATMPTTHPFISHLHNLAISIGIDLPAEKLVQGIAELARSFGLFLYDKLSALASNMLLISFQFIVMTLIVFALFVSGSALKEYVMDLSPLPWDEKEHLVHQFNEIARAVFVGNGLVGIAEGILGGLGMYWFGFGQGLFWGVVMALAAFLPVVGGSVIFLPAFCVLLLKGDLSVAFGYLIYNIVYILILEVGVKPHLIGGKSRMHVVLVFLSVLAAVQVFGPLGIFYGPLVVTMFMSLAEIYKHHYREQLFK